MRAIPSLPKLFVLLYTEGVSVQFNSVGFLIEKMIIVSTVVYPCSNKTSITPRQDVSSFRITAGVKVENHRNRFIMGKEGPV